MKVIKGKSRSIQNGLESYWEVHFATDWAGGYSPGKCLLGYSLKEDATINPAYIIKEH